MPRDFDAAGDGLARLSFRPVEGELEEGTARGGGVGGGSGAAGGLREGSDIGGVAPGDVVVGDDLRGGAARARRSLDLDAVNARRVDEAREVERERGAQRPFGGQRERADVAAVDEDLGGGARGVARGAGG